MSLNVPASPGIPIGGFGLPFSPIQLALPDLDLPTELVEAILDLIKQIGAIFPSGIFKANFDFGIKNVLAVISQILSQLAPYLSLYNLFQAVLQMFVCIIEILCAIPNPVLLIIKLKKLFMECLPNLLAIFPFLALILMIISLLLLLIALIQYIIATVLKVIDEIIKNILVVADALQLQDAESTLAVAQKIAALLCFIDNLMSIFVAIAAIMSIIQALMQIGGSSICSDEDPEGCCSADICPPFIKQSDNGIQVDSATLLYHHEIDTDLDSIFSIPGLFQLMNIPPLRSERWQVYANDSTPQYPIVSIITPVVSPDLPFNGQIFYPEATFTKDSPPNRSPYTVNMRILMDPKVFNPADVLGIRYMRVNDCIVVERPYQGVTVYDNSADMSNITGTFHIEGGKVFEDDGTTKYLIAGEQATLNNFVHMPASLGSIPPFDDGYVFSNIEMTWFPVHESLVSYSLITIGCVPEVSIEKAVQNAILAAEGIEPVFAKLAPVPAGKAVPSTGVLPNVSGAQQCVTDATAKLRKSVSAATVAEFQAQVLTCLGDLLDQTTAAYCGAVLAGVSQFKSTFILDTDAQFTTRPINLSVSLNRASGQPVTTNMPADCASSMADKLKADVTFGDVSAFTYDGYAFFNAEITSDKAGKGDVGVSFDGKVLNTVTPGSGYSTPSSITETRLNYEFISTTKEPAVRRGNEAD
jgi:hypothetical protein